MFDTVSLETLIFVKKKHNSPKKIEWNICVQMMVVPWTIIDCKQTGESAKKENVSRKGEKGGNGKISRARV